MRGKNDTRLAHGGECRSQRDTATDALATTGVSSYFADARRVRMVPCVRGLSTPARPAACDGCPLHADTPATRGPTTGGPQRVSASDGPSAARVSPPRPATSVRIRRTRSQADILPDPRSSRDLYHVSALYRPEPSPPGLPADRCPQRVSAPRGHADRPPARTHLRQWSPTRTFVELPPIPHGPRRPRDRHAVAPCRVSARHLALTTQQAYNPGETCSITRYAVAVSCAPPALMCTVTASSAAWQPTTAV
jgi:hypothetical protein